MSTDTEQRRRDPLGRTHAERIAAWHTYADGLAETAAAYQTAADAPGMQDRKAHREASAYLHSEADRLRTEAESWHRMAEEQAERWTLADSEPQHPADRIEETR